MKKILSLIIPAIVLTACTSGPHPMQANNGQYYMIDSSCHRYKVHSGDMIECENKKGEFTGFKNPMSLQELQQYHYQQQIAAQNIMAFTNAINGISSAYTQGQIQRTNQYNQYSQQISQMPQPYIPPVGNQNIRCNHVSNSTTCFY